MGSAAEREHWFPVAFAGELDETTMIPFDLFNVPWVAFRDEKGSPGASRTSARIAPAPSPSESSSTARCSARITDGNTAPTASA